MDAFYASVELRRRPELRGKPVIVCGSGPRAVVTTASYEARKLAGIHSAMPAATARRRLPDAVYLPPDFDAYREASGQVMAVLRRNVETVEVVGLDEAYLELTGLFSPKATMRRIAAQIKEETGLGCSVGISENRLLAKITSELGKPGGLVVLSRAEALERFAPDPPGLLPGIGPKTQRKLERLGLRTLAELRAADVEALKESFGPRTGPWLCQRAHFLDETPVTTHREAKSHSVERTFDTDVADFARMAEIVESLSAELSRRLKAKHLTGQTIAIKIRQNDWTTITRARTVDEQTNEAATIAATAGELLRENVPERPVRLLGVRLASLAATGEAEDAEGPAPPAVDEARPQLGLDV